MYYRVVDDQISFILSPCYSQNIPVFWGNETERGPSSPLCASPRGGRKAWGVWSPREAQCGSCCTVESLCNIFMCVCV